MILVLYLLPADAIRAKGDARSFGNPKIQFHVEYVFGLVQGRMNNRNPTTTAYFICEAWKTIVKHDDVQLHNISNNVLVLVWAAASATSSESLIWCFGDSIYIVFRQPFSSFVCLYCLWTTPGGGALSDTLSKPLVGLMFWLSRETILQTRLRITPPGPK